jgi:small conductance mechanosensitive channel
MNSWNANAAVISNWIMAGGLLAKLMVALLILLVGWIVIRIAKKMIVAALAKSTLDELLHPFILNTVRVVLWILLLLTILSWMGVPITAFLTALGAAGVAIALALRDSLSNFAGGIIILFSKPFKKGDHIEDLQVSGKVEKIDLLYTTISTFDKRIITMPNGKLANATVINYSKEPVRRVDFAFTASYDAKTSLVKEILRSAANSHPLAQKDPEPFVAVSGHGDHAINYVLRVWCNQEDYWVLYHDLLEQVKEDLDQAGVNIPYPQLDVHMV